MAAGTVMVRDLLGRTDESAGLAVVTRTGPRGTGRR